MEIAHEERVRFTLPRTVELDLSFTFPAGIVLNPDDLKTIRQEVSKNWAADRQTHDALRQTMDDRHPPRLHVVISGVPEGLRGQVKEAVLGGLRDHTPGIDPGVHFSPDPGSSDNDVSE